MILQVLKPYCVILIPIISPAPYSNMEVCMKRNFVPTDDSDSDDEVERALVSPYKRMKLSALPQSGDYPPTCVQNNKMKGKTMKVLQSQGKLFVFFLNMSLQTKFVCLSVSLSVCHSFSNIIVNSYE